MRTSDASSHAPLSSSQSTSRRSGAGDATLFVRLLVSCHTQKAYSSPSFEGWHREMKSRTELKVDPEAEASNKEEAKVDPSLWSSWLDTSSGARAVVGTALAMPGLCSGSDAHRSPITGPSAIRQLLISSRLSAISSCCPNVSC